MRSERTVTRTLNDKRKLQKMKKIKITVPLTTQIQNYLWLEQVGVEFERVNHWIV